MKSVHKIILANLFELIFIILIVAFAYHNLNAILAKFRFVEISDDLNASLLEMRLSEKNYFLFRDSIALMEIKKTIDQDIQMVLKARPEIIRAVGERNFEQLMVNLNQYGEAVEMARPIHEKDPIMAEEHVREVGRKMRDFSDLITHLERKKVNEMISGEAKRPFFFFVLVFVFVVVVRTLIYSKIMRSMREIEKVVNSISTGDYHKIEGDIPNDECGRVIKAINSMSDELKDREEQLVQSRKLASLGILTAGVAHELGNPLNNISMTTQAFLELYESLNKEERINYIVKVEEETERIKKIIDNLLEFSKPKPSSFKLININHVIRKTLRLVQNMLDVLKIETEVDLQGGLPPVQVDENQIQEVLINLITNAIQSMTAGGKLFIRNYLKEDRNYITIEVEDTGQGIPPEFLPHIFDPFFTTKGVEGTGLGLSVTYGIIKNHHGDIKVKSQPGVGTTFIVELPVYKGDSL
jgi:two-component system NtrC family sensor kinase